MPTLLSLARFPVALLLLVLGVLPLSAQDATPSTLLPGDRLDLAAMALTEAEMPPGYRQRYFDDEGYTPSHRMGAIHWGDTLAADEISTTSVRWFYSSTFATVDRVNQISLYLMEFPSVAAVEVGFALFEDERRQGALAEEIQDLPGPAAGQEPKEITVYTSLAPGSPGRASHVIDATFRVDRVLAGVQLIGRTPQDPALVEELAAALAERITRVLAGETPAGINPALPQQILPLFATWSWPGNSLEGYKDAAEMLGTAEHLAPLREAYESGYRVFASAGSVPETLEHAPPFLDVVIAEFTTSEAALVLLEAAEEELQHQYGDFRVTRIVAPQPDLAGVDDVRMFSTESLKPPGSILELMGTEVVFVLDNRLVLISAQVDGRRADHEPTKAIALELAAQQVACLQAETGCSPVQVPAALALATPVP